jgi:integrase
MKLDKYEKRASSSVSEDTLNTRLSILRQVDNFNSGELTVTDAEEFIEGLVEAHDDGEMKASSVREYYKAIGSYFTVVKGEPDALEHINWLPKSDSDPGDYMRVEEWESFFQTLKTYRNKAYFMLTYEYARRPTEVLLLNKEDIGYDEENDRDTITFSILKKGASSNTPTSTIWIESWDKEYDVYRTTFELKGEAKEHLETWIKMMDDVEETVVWKDIDREASPKGEYGDVSEGEEITVHPVFVTREGRMSYQSVYAKTKDAAEKSRVPEQKNITPKSIRHSRSTHLDWAGHSSSAIARNTLLHDPKTGTDVVSRYVHDRGEGDVREVMELGGDE